MNETEFRNELQNLLTSIYQKTPTFNESNLNGGYVEWHVMKFREHTSESWNDKSAAEYIQSLHADNAGSAIA